MAVADLPIDELLAELGYRDREAKRAARTALETAGLTTNRKMRIATHKLDIVRRTLAERFVLVCTKSTCHDALAGDVRMIVLASDATDCAICVGSANRVAIDLAIAALRCRGWSRVVVVGGSPGTRQSLVELVGDRLELRVVRGDERRTKRDATANLSWADVVVIWGSTELDHAVSKPYTDASSKRRVVTCPRRGVAALASTLTMAAR
jgi:hypothetical protein